MSKIETRLENGGWIKDDEVPLILDGGLLKLIDARKVDDDGTEHVFKSAVLYHKGDRYVFSWTRWDQSVIEGHISLADRKGEYSNGATHFDPDVEAVRAGFSRALTVNVEESVIRVWKKATQ